jgi:glycosyltransferase involved in cell wall biosynthesis
MRVLKIEQQPNPLKILILNSEYPPIGGGAGTATANLARCLAAQSQDIKVVTTRFGDLPFRENQDGFELIRLPAKRLRADRTNPGEQISFILVTIWFCLTHFHNWKPDIIWAFFGFPNGITALLFKIFLHIPYIVSLRGGDVPGFRPYDFKFFHRIGGPLIKIVWQHASAVVANSQGLQVLALEFYKRVPIRIIPNGVDFNFFKPVHRNWSPPRLLFIGRVVYQKGMDLLINALSQLDQLAWELSIVGDGSYKEQLQAQIDYHQLTNRIHFHGWCKKEELQPFLSQANIFINPSRHEGMPNAVLEAMASGLPVIASNISGNEELIRDGENGLLFISEDPEGLKNALEILMKNSALCKKMGKNARKEIEKNYRWEHSGLKYLQLLKDIVERK